MAADTVRPKEPNFRPARSTWVHKWHRHAFTKNRSGLMALRGVTAVQCSPTKTSSRSRFAQRSLCIVAVAFMMVIITNFYYHCDGYDMFLQYFTIMLSTARASSHYFHIGISTVLESSFLIPSYYIIYS